MRKTRPSGVKFPCRLSENFFLCFDFRVFRRKALEKDARTPVSGESRRKLHSSSPSAVIRELGVAAGVAYHRPASPHRTIQNSFRFPVKEMRQRSDAGVCVKKREKGARERERERKVKRNSASKARSES